MSIARVFWFYRTDVMHISQHYFPSFPMLWNVIDGYKGYKEEGKKSNNNNNNLIHI